MKEKPYIKIECPKCGAKLRVDNGMEYWYCGHCGERFQVTEPAEGESAVNKTEPEKRKVQVVVKKKKSHHSDSTGEVAEVKETVEVKETKETAEEESAKAEPEVKPETEPEPKVEAAPEPEKAEEKEPEPEVKPESEKVEEKEPEPVAESKITLEKKPAPEETDALKRFVHNGEEKKPVENQNTAPVSEPVAETAKAVTPAPAPAPEKVDESEKMDTVRNVSKEENVPVASKAEKKQHSDAPMPDIKDPERPKNLPEFQIYLNHLQKYNGNSPVVMVPNGVTWIDEDAFRDNKYIQKVSIPNTVIAIGASAFEGCSELTEVSLPSGLKKINYMTFNGCKNLRSIVIPPAVDEIMFNSLCCGLREITFKSADTRWETVSDSTNPSFIIDKSGTGTGVSKICFDNGVQPKKEFDAKEVFRHRCIRNYFINNELCQYCGGQFKQVLFKGKKCKDCGADKDYT